MTRMVQCIKLGKEAPGMKFAPLPNELGKRIFDNVSQEAWDAWTRHQTMLINENRLSLADPRARQYLAQQMESYFFGEGADQCKATRRRNKTAHPPCGHAPHFFMCSNRQPATHSAYSIFHGQYRFKSISHYKYCMQRPSETSIFQTACC